MTLKGTIMPTIEILKNMPKEQVDAITSAASKKIIKHMLVRILCAAAGASLVVLATASLSKD